MLWHDKPRALPTYMSFYYTFKRWRALNKICICIGTYIYIILYILRETYGKGGFTKDVHSHFSQCNYGQCVTFVASPKLNGILSNYVTDENSC